MLNRNAADVAFGIKVENRVLVEILRFNDFRCFELDVLRVRVLEVFDFHPYRYRHNLSTQ